MLLQQAELGATLSGNCGILSMSLSRLEAQLQPPKVSPDSARLKGTDSSLRLDTLSGRDPLPALA
eukprot:1974636-Amphidinium_carterae.1